MGDVAPDWKSFSFSGDSSNGWSITPGVVALLNRRIFSTWILFSPPSPIKVAFDDRLMPESFGGDVTCNVPWFVCNFVYSFSLSEFFELLD